MQNSYRLYDGAIDLGTLLSFLFYKGVASVASIMAGVLVSKNFKTAPKVYGAAIVTMALVYWFCIDEKTQLFGIVGQFLFTAIPVIVGIVAIIIGFSSDPKNR